MFGREVAKLLRDQELGFDLDQGSSGTAEKEVELLRRITGLTFGDIGWNEDGGSSQLACQAVGLVARKCLCCVVNINHEIHRFLPRNQFTVGLSHSLFIMSGSWQ